MAGRAVTVRTGEIWTIDTRSWHNLAVNLQKTDRRAYRVFERDMRRVGDISARRARVLAGRYSKEIPPTIKVSASRAQIVMKGGSRTAPIGGLYELGNVRAGRRKGVRGKRFFRHPVFGDMETWVNQPMHPYLFPAYLDTGGEVKTALMEVLTRSFQANGIPARTGVVRGR